MLENKSKIISLYNAQLEGLEKRCITRSLKNLLAFEISERLKLISKDNFKGSQENELKKLEEITNKIAKQENLPQNFSEFYKELVEDLKQLPKTLYFDSLRREIASAQKNLTSDKKNPSGSAIETLTFYYPKIKGYLRPNVEIKIENSKPITERKVTKIEVKPNNAKSRYEVVESRPDPDIIKSSLFCHKNKVLKSTGAESADHNEEKKTHKKR